jgi:hypothetical protein
MQTFVSVASRLVFLGSFLLAAVAVWEKAANAMSLTVMRGFTTPSRLLDLAALGLLFVIALQLRELKGAIEGKGS